MSSMEEKFEAACAAKDIPGVVLLASDASGKFTYQQAFGSKTPTTPMDLDATFIMASCTKLITSICALQCVERGQIGLDEDVSRVLPELKGLDILTGFSEAGEATFKKSTVPITLRHLLTHTSGLGYDGMHPLLTQYRASRNEPTINPSTTMMRDITVPLVFEPGTSWTYGVSLDWAGLLVSRLNNTSLESYMQTNIWSPLNIKNITFHQETHPDVVKNLVKMTRRAGQPNYGAPDPDPELKAEWTDTIIYKTPTTDEIGGAGTIGSAVEYMRILTSLMSPKSPLLQPATIDLLFSPQFAVDSGSLKGYEEHLKFPPYVGAFASHPVGTKVNWGLGGMLVSEDFEYGKKKGTMSWSGVANTLWTVDRKAGLACFYGSNILPFGDFKSARMQEVFEKEMYRRLASARRGEKL